MSADRLALPRYRPLEDIAQRATRIEEELKTLDNAYYRSKNFLREFIRFFDRKLIQPGTYGSDWEISGSCQCTSEFLNPTIPEIMRRQLGNQGDLLSIFLTRESKKAFLTVRNANRNTGIEVGLILNDQDEPFDYHFTGIRGGPWFGYGEDSHFEELKALSRRIDLRGPLAAYFFMISGHTLERAVGHNVSESPKPDFSGFLE